MSDSEPLIKRRPDGTLLPGHAVLNPKGRSKLLPPWFVERGDDALKHLIEVAEGREEDRAVSRAECCLKIVERIYGRIPAAPEDQDAEGSWSVLLARITKAQRPRDEG